MARPRQAGKLTLKINIYQQLTPDADVHQMIYGARYYLGDIIISYLLKTRLNNPLNSLTA